MILWRCLFRPGHEAARLIGTRLEGCAVFAHEDQPCRLDYVITCDDAWRTQHARVTGWVGDREIDVDIATNPWRLNGVEVEAVRGCTDVDLNFSPSTNLLPIRRLNLAIETEATVRAAWLRFPSFQLEPLEQVYRRLARDRYRYSSAGGSFVAELTVDENGFPTDYPGGWTVERSKSEA